MATITKETTKEKKAASDYDDQMGFASDGNQYLTFKLGDEQYGVEILRVQEIKGYTGVTRIPNIPEHYKGVLNLRGTIVPIVDLRMKFGMESVDYTKMTVIIVVEVNERVMGMIVDTVSDVMNIAAKDVQPVPEFGSDVDVGFISGIGNYEDTLVTFLDIDKVLSVKEIDQANEAADASQ